MVVAGAVTNVVGGQPRRPSLPTVSSLLLADKKSDDDVNQHRTLSDVHRAQILRGKTGLMQQMRPRHPILDSPVFEVVIAMLALLNAIQIGMAADLKHGHWPEVMVISEHMFTAIFFLEMVFKLKVFKWSYFKDRWNLLDFSLVVPAVLDNWILSVVLSDNGEVGSLTVMRILRLARFARMFRMARQMEDLASLIEALVYSLRTMFWAYLLLFMLVYLYALVMVEFVGNEGIYPGRSEEKTMLFGEHDGWNNYQYFGTVLRSMYSLFSIITLSEFSMTTRPIFERQPLFVLVIISFTCLSAFGIMNVVVGLMVQQALDVSHSLIKEKEALEMDQKMGKVAMIKRVLDEMHQKSGHLDEPDITFQEFTEGMLASAELVELLMAIDLPPNITIEEIFILIDASGDGHVSSDEFESQLLRLVDCTQFQQTCVLQVSMNEMKREMIAMKRQMKKETEVVKYIMESIKQGAAPGNNVTNSSSSGSQDNVASEVAEMRSELRLEMSKMRDELMPKMDELLLLSRMSTGDPSSAQRWQGVGWEQLPNTGTAVQINLQQVQAQPGDRLMAVPSTIAHSPEILDWRNQNRRQGLPSIPQSDGCLQGSAFLRACSSPAKVKPDS